MINVVIYIDDQIEPKPLVFKLLENRLIAKASIDINNESYFVKDGEIMQSKTTVITAQTKALLFTDIEKYLHDNYGDGVRMYSMPITQANSTFDSFIRKETLKT